MDLALAPGFRHWRPVFDNGAFLLVLARYEIEKKVKKNKKPPKLNAPAAATAAPYPKCAAARALTTHRS